MKQTFAERQERLVSLYQQACLKGLCSSRGEFAGIVGVSRQTMSSAMNGAEEYLTSKLIERAERIVLPEIHISMENSDESHNNVQKNFGLPEGTDEPKITEVAEIVKTLTEEMAKERESHERIMLALIQKIGQ